MSNKQIVFSGIQPTGNITIGNYLGAIKKWVSIQNKYNCLFCIADLHALTTNFSPHVLKDTIKYSIALCIAAGLDVDKVIIFQQSKISEHSELGWILSCFIQTGRLNTMTQFKNRCEDNKNISNLGLYSYPVLMAADILLYNTHIVPIGEDQTQHIELVRDIAISFNKKLRHKVFNIPNALINNQAKRIMSLNNAAKKMSKSYPSDFSKINMSDDKDLIIKKIRKAKTDNIKGISYSPSMRPEISNLVNIYSCLTELDITEIENNFYSAKTLEFKEALADVIISHITPINEKAMHIMEDQVYLERIIQNGTQKAKNIASKNFNFIKQILGIK